MLASRAKVQRFSLLILSENEYVFDDYRSSRIQDGRVTKPEKGSLKICSHSLIFVPDDISVPITRYPLKEMSMLEAGDSGTDMHIKTVLSVDMKTYNRDTPYIFCKTETDITFKFEFIDVHEVKQTVDSLQTLCKLSSTSEQAAELANMITAREARITFDWQWISDLREQTTFEGRCQLLTPLVENPGRIVITNKNVYFQPFHSISARPVEQYRQDTFQRIEPHRHLLQDVGFEIFFLDNTSILLAFSSPEQCDQALEAISISYTPSPSVLPVGIDPLEHNMQLWLSGKMSNLDYLMNLNTMAHRSINDLAQYPVFPWIIADYTSASLDLSNPSTFRDLSKPVGMLDEAQGKYFQQRYHEMPDPKYFYGTHYSAPALVCFYLVRQDPGLTLKLQNGKFDHADRAFDSIQACWQSVNSNHSDNKELIPQFFQPSESSFLKNSLELELGSKQNGARLGDVELPPWASTPHDFVEQNRAALESNYVSDHLHLWIDLIFGAKQQGEAAVAACNVFHPMTYEGHVKLNEIDSLEERRAVEAQICEFGQTPKQLFTFAHPRKGSSLATGGSSELHDAGTTGPGEEIGSDAPSLAPQEPHEMAPRSAWGSVATLVREVDMRLHQGPITGLCVAGELLLSTAMDNTLSAFNITQREQIGSIQLGSDGLLACAVAGQRILAGSADNYIYECDVKSLSTPSTRVCGHQGPVTGLHAGDTRAVSVSQDGNMKVWDYGMAGLSRQPVASYCQPSQAGIQLLDSDPGLQLVLTGDRAFQITMWDLRMQGALHSLQLEQDITAMRFCGRWQQVVCSDADSVKWFDLRKPDEALHTIAFPGVQCMATDDVNILLGSDQSRLSVLSCEELGASVGSGVMVEHGRNKTVTNVYVGTMVNGTDKVISSTSVGTVQLWECPA